METRVIANVRVGKPDTTPDRPSHVKGVREGNLPGSTWRQRGIQKVRRGARETPHRSTGINPRDRMPIDPRMPSLSPP